MKKNINIKTQFSASGSINESVIPEGYPDYPENEDIYYKFKKARSIDPEDITTYKEKEINEVFTDNDFNETLRFKDVNNRIVDSDENEEIELPEIEEDVNFSFQGDDLIDPIENLEY